MCSYSDYMINGGIRSFRLHRRNDREFTRQIPVLELENLVQKFRTRTQKYLTNHVLSQSKAIERTMQAGEKLGWWGDYAARFVAFPMIVGGVLGAVWNMIGLTRAKDMVEDHKRQKGRLYCQSKFYVRSEI